MPTLILDLTVDEVSEIICALQALQQIEGRGMYLAETLSEQLETYNEDLDFNV